MLGPLQPLKQKNISRQFKFWHLMCSFIKFSLESRGKKLVPSCSKDLRTFIRYDSTRLSERWSKSSFGPRSGARMLIGERSRRECGVRVCALRLRKVRSAQCCVRCAQCCVAWFRSITNLIVLMSRLGGTGCGCGCSRSSAITGAVEQVSLPFHLLLRTVTANSGVLRLYVFGRFLPRWYGSPRLDGGRVKLS